MVTTGWGTSFSIRHNHVLRPFWIGTFRHWDIRWPNLAIALLRFSVIWVGIADRVRAGNAAGADDADPEYLARCFARRGLDVITRS